MYDTYYKIPTRQTTCHEASRDKFRTWEKTFLIAIYSLPAVPDPSLPSDEASDPISSMRRHSLNLIYLWRRRDWCALRTQRA